MSDSHLVYLRSTANSKSGCYDLLEAAPEISGLIQMWRHEVFSNMRLMRTTATANIDSSKQRGLTFLKRKNLEETLIKS